jgi:hypothetical protein
VRRTLFHPAIVGVSITDLATGRPTLWLRVRMEVMQLGWYLLFAGRAVLARAGRTDAGRFAARRLARLRARP